MAEQIHTVLVVVSGTDPEGEDFKTPYRLFRRHWKKLGGLKDTPTGEKGFADWLGRHDPSMVGAKVSFIRYEDPQQNSADPLATFATPPADVKFTGDD